MWRTLLFLIALQGAGFALIMVFPGSIWAGWSQLFLDRQPYSIETINRFLAYSMAPYAIAAIIVASPGLFLAFPPRTSLMFGLISLIFGITCLIGIVLLIRSLQYPEAYQQCGSSCGFTTWAYNWLVEITSGIALYAGFMVGIGTLKTRRQRRKLKSAGTSEFSFADEPPTP